MRDLSRVLAVVGLAGALLPSLALAAPADESAAMAAPPPASEPPAVPPGVEGPPVDGDGDELPLDTDSDPLPLDTDADADTDTDTDTDADFGAAPSQTVDGDAYVAPADDYLPLRDSPEARTARRWLGAGIAATSVGAVLVGGGVAMGLSQPCDPNAGNNCFTDARDRAALTMAVPGGVMLLGGITMTIVGALQKRRLFFTHATPNVALSRDQIGLVVVGRF